VNNAGIIAVGGVVDLPVARMRRLLDINIIGVINGVHACVPLLKATRGRIVNVSSIAALTGWAYAAAYSASKGAVTNLTEALAAELGPSGVAVCDVLPGFVATQLVGDDEEVAALRASFKSLSIAFTSPGRVARTILAATESPRLHHIVGRQGRVYGFLTRHVPRFGRMMTRGLAARYARTLEALRDTRSARAHGGDSDGSGPGDPDHRQGG
jgi:short-subunit dehydrogenase